MFVNKRTLINYILIQNFQEMLRPISEVATQQEHSSKNLQIFRETPPLKVVEM